MGLVRLDDVTFGDAEVDAAFRRWRQAIELACNWEVTGAAEFNPGPAGFELFVRGPERLQRAVVTTAIPAAPSATTVSNTGRARLRVRDAGATTLRDSDIVTVYGDWKVAVAVGTRILVAPDGGGYMLIAADCPA